MQAERITKTVTALLFVAVLSFAVVQTSLGETQIPKQLPTGLRSDSYVGKLEEMLKAWNSGDLILPPKSKLRPIFEDRLKEILKEKKYTYQDQTWADIMRKKFDMLPESIKRERPLTDVAQALLIILFSKDLADFKGRVPIEKAKDSLNLPSFLLFGRAQAKTVEAGEPYIDAGRILESIFWWWTTTWPFCD